MKEILSMSIEEHKEYETMSDLISAETASRTIVIIDNQWFSWLHDIRFNYRDSSVGLPYYMYELLDLGPIGNQSLNKGHILIDKTTDTWLLRYNYDLKMMPVTINQKLILFNLDTHKKYSVSAKAWYKDTFNLEELYTIYLMSAYDDFDELLEKHLGGYHYINRQFKGFRNVEWNKRKALELPNFKENQLVLRDYRDVRQYRKEELFGNSIHNTVLSYKIRRLKFDCLLCCIIKHGSRTTDKEFNDRYEKLKAQSCILSYKPYYNAPPLIFKSYWYGVGNADAKRSIRKHV